VVRVAKAVRAEARAKVEVRAAAPAVVS
jgi:hypothetical protein